MPHMFRPASVIHMRCPQGCPVSRETARDSRLPPVENRVAPGRSVAIPAPRPGRPDGEVGEHPPVKRGAATEREVSGDGVGDGRIATRDATRVDAGGMLSGPRKPPPWLVISGRNG